MAFLDSRNRLRVELLDFWTDYHHGEDIFLKNSRIRNSFLENPSSSSFMFERIRTNIIVRFKRFRIRSACGWRSKTTVFGKLPFRRSSRSFWNHIDGLIHLELSISSTFKKNHQYFKNMSDYTNKNLPTIGWSQT